ncbi:MAG: hypothetical protein Kow0075_06100 [Salibacteraceae bacterium]
MGKFEIMKGILFSMMILLFLLASCKKEEPFEYPDNPTDLPEQWNVEVERTITDRENWSVERESSGCRKDVQLDNLAFVEIDTQRHFININLTPLTDSCELMASVSSRFRPNEDINASWKRIKFEYTFNELRLQPEAELWLELNYKTVSMRVNLAPAVHNTFNDSIEDGLVVLTVEEDQPVLLLNGIDISNDLFVSGNSWELSDVEVEDEYFKLSMFTADTPLQSFIGFKYLRLSRWGTPG